MDAGARRKAGEWVRRRRGPLDKIGVGHHLYLILDPSDLNEEGGWSVEIRRITALCFQISG